MMKATWILAFTSMFVTFNLKCQISKPDILTDEIFEYYEKLLPESYIKRIRELKIVGHGSKRMDEFQALLDLKRADPLEMISCVQKNYETISVSELQDLLGKIKRYLNQHANLSKCQGNKVAMNESELIKIYSDLRSKSLYNNDYPAGNCFDRAYLISKELDERGLISEQLLINDYVVAAYKTNDGYVAESYPVHIVNIVKVDINGQTLEYVLDPIYLESPLLLSDYKAKFLIQKDSVYITKHPQDFIEGQQASKSCSYNDFELEVARQNIMSSQSKKPRNICEIGTCFNSPELAIQNFKRKYFNP
jgi:hypothetical protein